MQVSVQLGFRVFPCHLTTVLCHLGEKKSGVQALCFSSVYNQKQYVSKKMLGILIMLYHLKHTVADCLFNICG